MEFREQVLANGLEIVAEHNSEAHSMALGFFVKAGSRDENASISGVSHFLEHMLFKGTPRRSAADVNRELDEIGSHANAYTSEEQTVYYAAMLPEYQDRALDVLADILRPSLREDDFETEKQVIVEEIYKYEDQPPYGAHEKCMAAFFGEHPLGKNILGSVDSVRGLTPDSMRAYFETRYSPGNMVLAASGNFDFDRLTEHVERLCGSWPHQEVTRALPEVAPHAAIIVQPKELATQQYTVQISSAPAATDEDRYAARVLTTILGDDSGSRMYWELVDTGLAEYAGMAAYEFQGTGIYMTFLCDMPDHTADNLTRMDKIIAQVQQEGVTEDELELAKSKIASHVVLRGERPSSRLFSVGNGWIQRREYRTVRQTVDAYRAVTREDIARVLERFPLAQNATVAVGPLTNLDLYRAARKEMSSGS